MPIQFSAPKHQALLSQNQLGDFEHIWAYQAELFEPTYRESEGWSGLAFISLSTTHAEQQDFANIKSKKWSIRWVK